MSASDEQLARQLQAEEEAAAAPRGGAGQAQLLFAGQVEGQPTLTVINS